MVQRVLLLVGFLWGGVLSSGWGAPPVRVPAPAPKVRPEAPVEAPRPARPAFTADETVPAGKTAPTAPVIAEPSARPAPSQVEATVPVEKAGTDPRRTGRVRKAKKERVERGKGVPLMAPLRVMTANLRFASTNQPNAWSDRRPAARAFVQKFKPDVMGTQEGLYGQIKDLEQDLPQYSWIGLGREGGSKGEFMAVFYRKDRLVPLAFDHFWLSDTPLLMGSATWGNQVKRMVTWVRFRDVKSGAEFFCFNTHFDHQSEKARLNSAKLLGGMIASAGTNAPVVLLGDFNARLADSEVHSVLVQEGGLQETWHYTREKRGELSGTFHDYGLVKENMGRIDWILTRGPWECDLIDTPRYSHRGQRPSDHWWVMADLRLK